MGAAAGLAVLGAAVLVLPAFVRYLRSGGWPAMRAHMLRAAGATLLTAAMTAGLAIWAHHLTGQQRNGGSAGYTALFVATAALVVATLVLWTVVAVVAARRISFSGSVLAVEAVVAVAVALAVVGILAATGWWWDAMAERAPAFLGGSPSSPLDAQVVATVGLMALAAALATAGAIRIVGSLPAWRRS